MNNKEIHKKLIDKLGVTDNVIKVIQELGELTELLRLFLSANMVDDDNINHYELRKLFGNIKEERCDVENCLDKLDELFHFKYDEIVDLKRSKMVRTLGRLNE